MKNGMMKIASKNVGDWLEWERQRWFDEQPEPQNLTDLAAMWDRWAEHANTFVQQNVTAFLEDPINDSILRVRDVAERLTTAMQSGAAGDEATEFMTRMLAAAQA